MPRCLNRLHRDREDIESFLSHEAKKASTSRFVGTLKSYVEKATDFGIEVNPFTCEPIKLSDIVDLSPESSYIYIYIYI